jgi:uncharacterized protein (TIGR03067 family)
MKRIAAILFALIPVAAAGAPVPNLPPAPSIEGKYTLLTSGPSGKTGRGFATDPALGGGFGPASLRRETHITKDTIQIEGSTTSMHYRIDPSTKPMSIDITIAPLRGKKTKHLGIMEVTGDKLSIAYGPDGGERPKDFEEADGVRQYVFQKAPPPPRAEYRIVVLTVGQEGDAEKQINALAKDGFEVAFTSNPTSGKDPVIHLVLKRMVSGK